MDELPKEVERRCRWRRVPPDPETIRFGLGPRSTLEFSLTPLLHSRQIEQLCRQNGGCIVKENAFGPVKQIVAGDLNVGYVDLGSTDGQAVLLLHG